MNQVEENLARGLYQNGARGVSEASIERFINDCNAYDFNVWKGITFNGNFELKSCGLPPNLEIINCKFKDFKLLGMIFSGSVLIYGCEFSSAQFANIKNTFQFAIESCSFEQDVLIDGKFKHAKYIGCEFKGPVTFRGFYEESVLFMSCRFSEKVKWLGILTLRGIGAATLVRFVCSSGAHIEPGNNTPSIDGGKVKSSFETCKIKFKKCFSWVEKAFYKVMASPEEPSGTNLIPAEAEVSTLFGGTAQFQDVDFVRPDQVYFSSVCLARTTFSGTDLRGVHLEGVDFYQSSLARHGLVDEISVSNSKDEISSLYSLARLESAYRKMRVCLEESKDFGVATDMYVGEMEARRRQLPFFRRNFFSTEWLFKLVSKYGQSAWQAFVVLLALIGIHLLVSVCVLDQVGNGGLTLVNLDRTLKVISLQKISTESGSGILGIVDTIFRVLVPIQAGMLGLALRIKIKRH